MTHTYTDENIKNALETLRIGGHGCDTVTGMAYSVMRQLVRERNALRENNDSMQQTKDALASKLQALRTAGDALYEQCNNLSPTRWDINQGILANWQKTRTQGGAE